MSLKGCGLVKKRNVLNEIKNNNMTLHELRFFSIYLARINPRDLSTKNVTFKLGDFKKIMNFEKLNIQSLDIVVNKLICKIVKMEDFCVSYKTKTGL